MARALFVLSALSLAGCLPGAVQTDLDRLTRDVEGMHLRHASAQPGTASDPELDRALSGSIDLEMLLQTALSRNPELREALARAEAAMEQVRSAGALDDPRLKIMAESIPLSRPGGFNKDMDNRFGLEQDFPFPGILGLRAETALRNAEAAFQTYREKERDVVVRVKKTYIEYFGLAKELEIHREHVTILEEFEKISSTKFRAGTVSQQDVLKPQVELVLLHNDVFDLEQRLGASRAMLNLLLQRPDDAPLGEPREIALTEDTFVLKDLQARAASSRPEILGAALRRRASESGLTLAEREAALPSFSAGIEYWQIPGGDDAYGAMLAINLPWFTGKRAAEKRMMAKTLRADEIALERIRGTVMYEVRTAFLRVDATRKSVNLFNTEILPKSRQSVEASRASYEKDKATFLDLLDAERSLREHQIKYYHALVEHESALADLERAVGADLRRKP